VVASSKDRTAAVLSVVGTLFATLAVVTGHLPLWGAAAAINFLGAADALRPRPSAVPA
jgi:hypothetical protein